MQELIESLMIENNVNVTPRYNEFIRKIRWVNVIFNWFTEKPKETGESGINVMVDRTNSSDRIFLLQRISRCSVDLPIGAMILEPLSNKSWFAMSHKAIDNHGTLDEQNYQSNAVANFRKIMSDVNAVELYDDDAEKLIKEMTDIETK
ncbi:unnamed protein product, partial [Rotaria magnacalcarata]